MQLTFIWRNNRKLYQQLEDVFPIGKHLSWEPERISWSIKSQFGLWLHSCAGTVKSLPVRLRPNHRFPAAGICPLPAAFRFFAMTYHLLHQIFSVFSDFSFSQINILTYIYTVYNCLFTWIFANDIFIKKAKVCLSGVAVNTMINELKYERTWLHTL